MARLHYDQHHDKYLLEFIFIDPLAFGSLDITLRNEAGLQVGATITRFQPQSGETTEIPADSLVAGQEFRIEVTGTRPDGSVTTTERGSVILASRDFRHLPDQPVPRIQNILFVYEADGQALVIDFDAENDERFAAYRVVVEDKVTNVAVMNQRTPAADVPPLRIPFSSVPAGRYNVLIQALDENAVTLLTEEDEFTHVPPEAPRLLTVLLSTLRKNPIVALAILVIVLGVAFFLILLSVLERRATGTPVLQGHGLARSRSKGLAPNQTMQLSKTETAASTDGGTKVSPPRMRLQIVSLGDAPCVGKTAEVTHYPFIIGRGDCHLALSGDNQVSRRHIELRFAEGKLGIVDLSSTNGTFVNEQPIPAEQQISLEPTEATRIRLGGRTQLVLVPSQDPGDGL